MHTQSRAKIWRQNSLRSFRPALIAGLVIATIGTFFIWKSSAATITDSDLNKDGIVNITDMSMLLSHFNQTGTALVGDINSDGKVNLTDLSMLLSNYGKTVPVTPPPTTPPPTTPPPTTPPPTTPPPTQPPPTTPPPSDTPTPYQVFTGTITNNVSGGCVATSGTGSNTVVRVDSCSDNINQLWAYTYVDNGLVELRYANQCLTPTSADMTNPSYFIPLQLQQCTGSTLQQWEVFKSTNAPTQIVNYGITFDTPGNSLLACLDLDGDGTKTAIGTKVTVYACTDSTANTWTVADGSPRAIWKTLGFVSNTTKCIDLPSGTTTAGTQLQVWDCNSMKPQQFTIGIDINQRAKLSILGQCLIVKDGGTADGTPVQIGKCANTPAQDWLATRTGDNYTFKNIKSGKCLDTASGAVANSTLMVIRPCSASAPGQLFIPKG